MTRLHFFIFKYIFKIPKLKKEIKDLVEDKDELPKEWIYIKLRELSDEIFETANINVVVEGLENIPEETCVLYSNHQSIIDPLLVLKTRLEIGFILKKELEKNKLINNVAKITNSFYLDREDTREGLQTILSAIDNIKQGQSYLIFPEGTRSSNKLLDFKAGSFKLSTKTKTPIVPIAIINAKKAEESKNIKPCTAKVVVLKPLYYEEYKNLKTEEIAILVKNKIQEIIDLHEKGDK